MTLVHKLDAVGISMGTAQATVMSEVDKFYQNRWQRTGIHGLQILHDNADRTRQSSMEKS